MLDYFRARKLEKERKLKEKFEKQCGEEITELKKKHRIEIEDMKRDYSIKTEDRRLWRKRNHAEIENKYQTQIEDMKASHKREMEEKDLEIKYSKDKELLEAREILHEAQKKVAELSAENKMLEKLIVDVKELVKDLIGKLPEVNLQNLNVSTTCRMEEKKDA